MSRVSKFKRQLIAASLGVAIVVATLGYTHPEMLGELLTSAAPALRSLPLPA